MTHVQQMVQTNPTQAPVDESTLVECIEACFDCADVCAAIGKILSRQTAFDAEMARAALEACARACRICGDECEQHAEHHEHCQVCAEACRLCEQACSNVLSAIWA